MLSEINIKSAESLITEGIVKMLRVLGTFTIFFGSLTVNSMDVVGGSGADFIHHTAHHEKFSPEIRERLVLKGRSFLRNIWNGEEVKDNHSFNHLSNYQEFSNEFWHVPFVPYRDEGAINFLYNSVTSPLQYVSKGVAYCLGGADSLESSPIQQDSGHGKFVKVMSYDDTPPSQKDKLSYQRAYLESVVSVVWALYSYCYQEGQGFVRGALVLEDQESRIHDFLEKYACFAVGVQRPDQISYAISPKCSNFAYRRDYTGGSSHFVGRTKTLYGIDARFSMGSFALGVFPFQMSHLHFGRVRNHVGEEVTFIKLEEYGLGDNRSFARHAMNFAASGLSDGCRREKDLLPEIAESASALLALLIEDSKNSHYQDRVYALFNKLEQDKYDRLMGIEVKPFNECVVWNIVKPDIFKRLSLRETSTSALDIGWLYQLIHGIFEMDDRLDSWEVQANSLLETFKLYYNEETLYLRTGNEVLFCDDQLDYILKPYEATKTS